MNGTRFEGTGGMLSPEGGTREEWLRVKARFEELRDAPLERLFYDLARMTVRGKNVFRGVRRILFKEAWERFVYDADIAKALRITHGGARARRREMHLRARGRRDRYGPRLILQRHDDRTPEAMLFDLAQMAMRDGQNLLEGSGLLLLREARRRHPTHIAMARDLRVANAKLSDRLRRAGLGTIYSPKRSRCMTHLCPTAARHEEFLSLPERRKLRAVETRVIKPACETVRGIGEQIRAARLRAGMTQRCLAGRLGITRPMIHHWESNRSGISLDRLKAIEEILSESIPRPVVTLEEFTA